MIFTILLFLILIPVVAIFVIKSTRGPSKITQTSNATQIFFDKPPGPAEFYLNVVFSMNNLTKPGYLPQGKKLSRFEVICKDATTPSSSFKKFLKSCGFDESIKDMPLTWPFATSLPLAYPVLIHPKYPMKSMAGIVHMKQTISLLKPISRDEYISKRGIFEGGENTDRGSEFDFVTEVYNAEKQDKQTLVGKGVSSFLIIRKKKGSETKAAETKQELPAVTLNKTFKVPEHTGRQYAAASGDYNPWHLWASTAKIFGFRRAISQGFWSAGKCIAEIGDSLPKYPLNAEFEWKRPMFMPSSVTLTVRGSGDKVYFELTSEDKQHTHLVGFVEHVPNMKLEIA